jgi:hypothetical protein
MKYALACDSFRVSFRTFSQSSLALGYNMQRGYGVKDDRGDHREILLPFRTKHQHHLPSPAYKITDHLSIFAIALLGTPDWQYRRIGGSIDV